MATELKVDKRTCQKILKHAPADGGGYKPGVDVRGKKVVGANVAGSTSIKIPKDISFDYGIDLEAKYGLGNTTAATGNPTIGRVTVRGGRVFWNGQPLDGTDRSAIAAECGRVYGKK